MADKYNLTNENDFDEFVSAAAEAVSIRSKTDWSFSTGCGFTFATLTTVGKCPGFTFDSMNSFPSKSIELAALKFYIWCLMPSAVNVCLTCNVKKGKHIFNIVSFFSYMLVSQKTNVRPFPPPLSIHAPF